MSWPRRMLAGALAAGAIVLVAAPVHASGPPVARAAATCDDHPDQASAQRAKDSRDGDGDGIYCVIYPR